MTLSDEHIASGTVPQRTDTERWLLEKILLSTNSGGGGGGSTWGYVGHYNGVEPNVVPTVAGATARDLDAPFASWTWDGSKWF